MSDYLLHSAFWSAFWFLIGYLVCLFVNRERP